MARIRTIKPTIWTDDAFIELSRDARLLVIGMISQADDDGRLVASANALIGAIYPHDPVTAKQVESWLKEVSASGIAVVYRVGRATYAAFPKWDSHQVINKRSRSTLPAPSGNDNAVAPVVAPVVSACAPSGDSLPEVGSRKLEVGSVVPIGRTTAQTTAPKAVPARPADETSGTQNDAQAVVAAYIEGAETADLPRPGPSLIGQVGKQAKAMLSDNDHGSLVTAARTCGANGWSNLATQVQRDAVARKQQTRGPMDYVEVVPRQW